MTARLLFLALALAGALPLRGQSLPNPKQTPPPGVAIPEADRARLSKGAEQLATEIQRLRSLPAATPFLPDVEVLHKAVDWALRFDEFMDVKQIASARRALTEGMERAAWLQETADPQRAVPPWIARGGSVICGYRSQIDGSVQPYGVFLPEGWEADRTPRPLLVWLAGRNDKRTELAFLDERWKGKPEFAPPRAIVLFPYGRFCNATKFAGETDVFEAMSATRGRWPIDGERIAVAGFSMGGASCWHLAAHHSGLWAAASAGAGFAETAVYAKVFAAGKDAPPWWEQMLWRQYDATAVAGNFVNVPMIVYSGEIDPQIQSANIMEEALAAEGLKLERLVGPKTAHKYEPEIKKVLAGRLAELLSNGRELVPARVRLQTHTLRYPTAEWVTIDALERHWEKADVAAEITTDGVIRVRTKNVAALTLAPAVTPPALLQRETSRVMLDEQELTAPAASAAQWVAHFAKQLDGKWAAATSAPTGLVKRAGLQGPIDDAFMDSFLFVRPTGKPLNAKLGAWAQAEMERAIAGWRRVFRGEARVKDDTAITPEDLAGANLVLWGDPSSNRLLAQLLPKLPLHLDGRDRSCSARKK